MHCNTQTRQLHNDASFNVIPGLRSKQSYAGVGEISDIQPARYEFASRTAIRSLEEGTENIKPENRKCKCRLPLSARTRGHS
jgi:hypothetical protein